MMNNVERQQMTDALQSGLCHLCIFGSGRGTPSVRITEEGEIAATLKTDGERIVGPIGAIEDIAGDGWDTGLDLDNPREIARRLRDYAEAWVAKFGDAALEDARARISEEEAMSDAERQQLTDALYDALGQLGAGGSPSVRLTYDGRIICSDANVGVGVVTFYSMADAPGLGDGVMAFAESWVGEHGGRAMRNAKRALEKIGGAQ